MKKSKPASTPSKVSVSEAHIQETVTHLLQLDGWRAIRTDPVSDRGRGKGFGEVGMPDYLYVRYWNLSTVSFRNNESDVMWIEFKRPGKSAEPHQLEWHNAERLRGALVLVVNDIDDFVRWYGESGLARKVLQHGTKSKD